MTTKRFITPFAESGIKAPIADVPSSTDVNYLTGYTPEYALDPLTNPNARFVEITNENQILNDITGNIKHWQENTFPEFITPESNGGVAFEYKKGDTVLYDGVTYESLDDSNTDLPTASSWVIHKPNEVLKAILIAQGYSGNYGFFKNGFTYNLAGDIGIDTDGGMWTYADEGALPVTISAGDTPSSPVYYRVDFAYSPASKLSVSIKDLLTTNQQTLQDNRQTIEAESLGIYGDDAENPTANCSTLINYWLPHVNIRFKPTVTYTIVESLEIDTNQALVQDTGGGRAYIRRNDKTLKTPMVITKDFETRPVYFIKISGISFYGPRDLMTKAEVDLATGDDYIGALLSCARSVIDFRMIGVAGVGCIFTDNGDETRPVDSNEVHLVTRETGQEGIIFEAGLDHLCSYLEAQWAWDSIKDQDYTQTKVSKRLSGSGIVNAGCVFYKGSAQVTEMHHHNNHYGYAWATLGQTSRAYRLRVMHAIGESSLGSFHIGTLDDVTSPFVTAHGRFGSATSEIPFCRVASSYGCNITQLDIDLKNRDVKYALQVDGDKNKITGVNIYQYQGGKATSASVIVSGDNNKVHGNIAGTGSGIDTPFPCSNANINFDVLGTDWAFGGRSTNSSVGYVTIRARSVASVFNGDSRRFLSVNDVKRFDIQDITNSKTLKLSDLTQTIDASLCDGTDRTIVFALTDDVFTYTGGARSNTITVNSISVTSGDREREVWLSSETINSITVGYNITSVNDAKISISRIYTL